MALALLVSFQALLPEAPPIAARAAERGRAVRGFDVPSDVSLVLGFISTFQALPALVSRVLLHEVVVGRLRGVRPQDRSRNTLLSDGCSVSGEYCSAADADVTPPEAVLGFLFLVLRWLASAFCYRAALRFPRTCTSSGAGIL